MKILEEDPPLADERKLPWPIEVLLYPFSVAGMVHLAIFCLGPPLLGFISRVVLSRIYFGTLISLVLMIFLMAYALYYLACCVHDSSKGGRRAPDIIVQYAPDKSDLIAQIFLILGCIAVCFWPVAVYSVFMSRVDIVFWLLSAVGIFFFPMALLAGTLFDATHALNPIFIIASIFKTLPIYLGLVLFFCILGAIVGAVIVNLHNISGPQSLTGVIFSPLMLINYFFTASFIYKGMAFVYLAMVGAHLLGSFYWWHKDKLDWGL
jgi:hypothetical protein